MKLSQLRQIIREELKSSKVNPNFFKIADKFSDEIENTKAQILEKYTQIYIDAVNTELSKYSTLNIRTSKYGNIYKPYTIESFKFYPNISNSGYMTGRVKFKLKVIRNTANARNEYTASDINELFGWGRPNTFSNRAVYLSK